MFAKTLKAVVLCHVGRHRHTSLLLPFKHAVIPSSWSVRRSISTSLIRNAVSLSHPAVQAYLKEHENETRNNTKFGNVVRAILDAQKEVAELEVMGKENDDLREMAKADADKCRARLTALEQQLFMLMVEPDRMDSCDEIVVEVSAGVGGQEAMLFSDELLNMYIRYAEYKGWQCDVISLDETELGGVRHCSMSISGRESYKLLKFEGGVHRVQRVPKTEKSGRIHTSTSTVAVLPTPTEIDVQINPQDLKVETKRATGAGGQHVNTTESAIRVTHIPTGIVVDCQVDRSQIRNRATAMKKLRTKLYEREMERQVSQFRNSRKLQVGFGGRSEKIRTYNFVQDRVTDHRIGLTVHNLHELLGGGGALDHVVDQLQLYSFNERLEELFK